MAKKKAKMVIFAPDGTMTGSKKKGLPRQQVVGVNVSPGRPKPKPARVQGRGPHWESGVIKVRKPKRTSST